MEKDTDERGIMPPKLLKWYLSNILRILEEQKIKIERLENAVSDTDSD